mmetsp:Transcript_22296/g.41522  ORF Transcript_22296/g.41522 Transcript_22296/m.41522 type:complete len:264 (-) Transcript_22296:722-1513(-)
MVEFIVPERRQHIIQFNEDGAKAQKTRQRNQSRGLSVPWHIFWDGSRNGIDSAREAASRALVGVTSQKSSNNAKRNRHKDPEEEELQNDTERDGIDCSIHKGNSIQETANQNSHGGQEHHSKAHSSLPQISLSRGLSTSGNRRVIFFEKLSRHVSTNNRGESVANQSRLKHFSAFFVNFSMKRPKDCKENDAQSKNHELPTRTHESSKEWQKGGCTKDVSMNLFPPGVFHFIMEHGLLFIIVYISVLHIMDQTITSIILLQSP